VVSGVTWLRDVTSWWRDGLAAYPQLVVGERYVCDLNGDGSRLGCLDFLQLDEWVDASHLSGEGMIQSGSHAILEGRDGRTVALPRGQVLWPSREHAAIVAGTAALGLRLVPTARRPVPRWRLGGVRLDPAAVSALGRMVLAGRR
jgi:hypothetical protein